MSSLARFAKMLQKTSELWHFFEKRTRLDISDHFWPEVDHFWSEVAKTAKTEILDFSRLCRGTKGREMKILEIPFLASLI